MSQTTTENEPQRVSRVGKKPIAMPAGVTLTIQGSTVKAKGPKGELSRVLPTEVEVVQKNGEVLVNPKAGSGNKGTQYQGLSRALVNNLLEGVSKGFERALDLIGTGYRAEVKGQDLTLVLGLSHQVQYRLPDSVKAKVEILDFGGAKRPRLHLASPDKEILGQVAARLRSFRPPEPYKGKGVRYVGEKVREKEGKAAAGAKK